MGASPKLLMVRVRSIPLDGSRQVACLTHGSRVFAFTVSHHVCEQALEQAELGGDGAGDPGEQCSGVHIFSQLSDPVWGTKETGAVLLVRQGVAALAFSRTLCHSVLWLLESSPTDQTA